MKTSYFLFIASLFIQVFLSFHLGFSQVEKPSPEIGLSWAAISTRNIGPFENLQGAGSFSSKKYFGMDVSFLYPINNRFSFETGLGFSKQEVAYQGAIVDPMIERFKDTLSLKIFEIPILANMNMGKYFYANLGPILHFDVSGQYQNLDRQNGVGAQLGIGAKYNFSRVWTLYLEPTFKSYNLIPFESDNHVDRISQFAVKVGVRYGIR